MGSTEGSFFAAIEAGAADEVRAMVAAEPSLASARDEHGVSAVMRARYRFDQALLDAVLSGDPALDVFEAASLGDVERLSELLDADPSVRHLVLRPTGSPRCTSRRSSAGRRAARAPGGARRRRRRARPRVDDGHAVALRGRGSSRGRRAAAAGARAPIPNARQGSGWTPLHSAAHNGDLGHGRRCCSRTAPTPRRRTTTARPCSRWRSRAGSSACWRASATRSRA